MTTPAAQLEAPQRPSFCRRCVILALTALLILAGLEISTSALIEHKLKLTVARKLDAELRIDSLWYIPPLSAHVTRAALVREDWELVKLRDMNLKLARLPFGDAPVIIETIDLDQPVVHISPEVLAGGLVKKAKWKPDKKFSDMLRLTKLRLNEGRVEYSEPGGLPPTVWSSINVDIDTTQTSASAYTYALAAKAGWASELNMGGKVDVDSLRIDVEKLAMQVRAEPNPPSSPLPAKCQELLKLYDVSGALAINGSGVLPLRSLDDARGTLALKLDRATARIPKANIQLERATLAANITRDPCMPIVVTFDQFDTSGGGKKLSIQPGAIAQIDPLNFTWKLSKIRGRAHIDPPGDNPPPPTNKFEERRWAGDADFTARASGPLTFAGRKWWDAIEHEVIAYPRDAGFQPKRFPLRVEHITGGPVRLANGVITFDNLAAAYGSDEIRVKSMRLPVEGLPKLSHYQEICASVVFHYPAPPHTPKLQKVIDFLGPDGHFDIAGNYTIDKTLSDDPPKLIYDLLISSDRGTFNMTPKRIAFANLKGDGRATERGVEIERATADVLGGKAVVSGKFFKNDPLHGIPSTYEGNANLQGIDLESFHEAWGISGKLSRPLHGKMFLAGNFKGAAVKGEALKHIDAKGKFEVVQGDFFAIPVVKGTLEQMNLPTDGATVGDAAANFTIAGGVLHLNDAVVSAPILGVQGRGDIALDGSHMDVHVVAAPLADWRDGLKRLNIPIVSDVGSEIVGGIQGMLNVATGTLLYEFRVTGTAKNPTFTAVPAPVLTDAGATLFGQMLKEKKHQPSKYLKKEEPELSKAGGGG